jgi:hypothetical protein
LIFASDDGIVVTRSGREREIAVEIDEVPAPLEARLGAAATGGLIELFGRSHRHVKEELMTACTDRFDRRLVEESSGLRVQIAQSESTLRADIAAGRVEFIKWSFIFWVGQVLAVTGILTVLLRVLR